MTISYEKLNKGGYTRQRGKKWKCPKCGKENVNKTINPRSGEVQKCSLCGTPKPMIFGVRVCESCKISDQVDVLPAFVHRCPNCGSTELKRFFPITDEALREGIHPKYASLKWKCKCGRDNPYPYANCLNCGLSIDDGLNETSADTDEPKEAEEIAEKMRRSNWKCPYCGRTNRGIDEKCLGCGNSEKNPEDDIIRTIRPELFSDEISKPSQDSSRSNDQYAKQDSIHEIPGRKKFEFHLSILEKGESFLAGAISIAKKVWWSFPILFMILLIMGNFKEEEFIVSDMKYDITYRIEKYTTTHHTGESTYPVDAYNVVESQESRYLPDQDDNNDWGSNDWGTDWDTNDDWGTNWDTNDDWGSDWGTDDYWGSDWDTGDDWGSDDWNDYGGDYFDSIIYIIRRLRNSIAKRIEHYTVYEYDVDEWVYCRTINYSGGEEEIKSPELIDNEKIASSSTSYTIYLIHQKEGSSANLYSLKINEEEWQKYQVGDTIRVKTLFGYPQFIVEY